MIDVVAMQLGGDTLGNFLYLILFMVFMLFYPRLMIMQMLMKLERSAQKMESMAKGAKKTVTKKVSKSPTPKIRNSISNFLEFFAIPPSNLDPYGMVPKLDHIIKLVESRFKYFIEEVAPGMEKEEKANLMGGLSGALQMNQIAKVVRHYVEMVRKTKNLQIAMVLQMQLPLIERIAQAVLDGTEALSNGWPIGDSAGPVTASTMIGNDRITSLGDEDTIVVRKKIKRRNVLIVRAKGPGGRIGNPGDVVVKLVKKSKIAKIITIDAKVKLEGERTGGIAEGVGVAIGGVGTESFKIEEISTKRSIPLDSYAIKMSMEEAIQPMLPIIMLSAKNVARMVEDNISKTKQKGTIIVVGVGNCSGVGNNRAGVTQAENTMKKVQRIVRSRKAKKKKSKLDWLIGS